MKKLLLLSKFAEDQAFARETATAAGMALVIAQDEAHAKSVLGSETIHSFFYDTAYAATFAAETKAKKTLLASPAELPAFDGVAKSSQADGLIVRRYGDEHQAGQHYARVIRSTDHADRGLEGLGFNKAEIQSFQFESSIQKGFAATAVTDFLLEQNCSQRMASLMANAVDELLMNAMFDAEVDGSGQQLHKAVPRATDLSAKHVELQVGIDGTLIGFTITDHFGTLKPTVAMRHALRGFSGRQPVRHDDVSLGAGLGLALIVRSGGSILFVTQPGVRTDVTVFFRKLDSMKAFKEQFQFTATHVV